MRRQHLQARFQQEALEHLPALYRFSVGLTRDPTLAEDLVQETFKEAWISFATFTAGTDCRKWMFRILFRTWGRMRSKMYKLQEVELTESIQNNPPAHEDPEVRLQERDLRLLLASLPEHYREVIVLADIEEFGYREISEILNVPLGTVMSRLNRARSLLRDKVGGRSERKEGTG